MESKKIIKRSELVKAVRNLMGLNQTQFAKKMNVDQSAVSYWETDTYEFVDERLNQLKYLFEEKSGPTAESIKLFKPFIKSIVEVK